MHISQLFSVQEVKSGGGYLPRRIIVLVYTIQMEKIAPKITLPVKINWKMIDF